MNIIDIIEKKRDGKKLSKSDINYFIGAYVNNDIKDYQASALLMAIYINGMDDEEAFNLTEAMIASGEVISFENKTSIFFDKHSTGGVGDKLSLIIGPIIAAMSYKFIKLSGRSLGFTGGTIDKLESIRGLSFENLKDYEYLASIKDFLILPSSDTVAKADKMLYKLRDVTATVNSIPLIAGSIMSKKLAFDSDCLIIDVKCGNGAFMKNYKDAKKLASLLKTIGKRHNRKMCCLISNMDQPLGNYVGNLHEIYEVLEFLKGNKPEDLRVLAYEIIYNLIKNYKDEIVEKEIIFNKIDSIINSGQALNIFYDYINFMGGDITFLKSLNVDSISKYCTEIVSKEDGYVSEIDCIKIAHSLNDLGAGRLKIEDKIDYTVGAFINKKINDKVSKGETLIKIYHNAFMSSDIFEQLNLAYSFSLDKKKINIIYEVI